MKDVLDQMTKEELISWMRYKCWNKLPKLSDVLFARWEIESRKHQERDERETAEFAGIDTKLRDQLARQHNESNCMKERASLIDKIIVIDKQVQAYFDKIQKTSKNWERIQTLYDRASAERDKGN